MLDTITTMTASAGHIALESVRTVFFMAHAVYLISGVLVLVMLESDMRVLKSVARFTL